MALPLVAAALALAVVYIAAHFILGHRRSGGNRRPRRYPPVAGTIIHQLLNLHRFAEFHGELARKHRTFRMLTPMCNYVYTVDPANVEYILKSNFANYGKGKMTHELLEDLFGDGIFAVDGDKWRQQRKIASFEFSTKMLREYSSDVFRSSAARLALLVADAAASGLHLDIQVPCIASLDLSRMTTSVHAVNFFPFHQELLMKATMDSIFKVAFGVELNSLAGADADCAAFARAFDAASGQVLLRFVDVLWKLKRALNIGSEKTMRNNIRVIDGFVYAVIDKKMKQMTGSMETETASSTEKKEDILTRFLREAERDPDSGIDRKYLRDIMLNFIIAGRDTTAVTLSWFVYQLCRHPQIQEKVAAEVSKATAGDGAAAPAHEFTTLLTEDSLGKMHYLHAALTETLRLHPAVPVDVKCCFADDTLPDGFDIKEGDLVNYVPYAMGRMEVLWGQDAEVFRPERWLDADDGTFVAASPYKFTAFQAGPRICLGKEFAYRQMKIFAAVLLRHFRFELWGADVEVKSRSMVTLHIDGELRVRVTMRTS